MYDKLKIKQCRLILFFERW